MRLLRSLHGRRRLPAAIASHTADACELSGPRVACRLSSTVHGSRGGIRPGLASDPAAGSCFPRPGSRCPGKEPRSSDASRCRSHFPGNKSSSLIACIANLTPFTLVAPSCCLRMRAGAEADARADHELPQLVVTIEAARGGRDGCVAAAQEAVEAILAVHRARAPAEHLTLPMPTAQQPDIASPGHVRCQRPARDPARDGWAPCMPASLSQPARLTSQAEQAACCSRPTGRGAWHQLVKASNPDAATRTCVAQPPCARGCAQHRCIVQERAPFRRP